MEAELPFPDAKDGSGSLDAVGIVKRYAIVSVLEGVDCSLRPGHIHTVVGENGAGKSTLFKIMSGLVQPTNGALKLDGEPITLSSPRIAHHRGIYLVPQEPALMAELSVAETMFVGQLPTAGGLISRIDWAEARRRSAEALETHGVVIWFMLSHTLFGRRLLAP